MKKMIVEAVNIFCSNTTMRGFGKLWRTQHRILRVLWSVYIISMVLTLTVSSYFLIAEYASLFTTVQETMIVQDVTEFPSITVCSMRPIGKRADPLWRNGTVISPQILSQRLRQSIRHALREDKLGFAKDLFYADRVSTYFQNIPIEYLAEIGVQKSDLILFCLMRHSKHNNPSVSHDELCQMKVRRLRHAVYGNCYEIQVAESRAISSVSLVLQAGQLVRNQVQDVFKQAGGLRLTLHEPGTVPQVDSDGISVALGRLTDIKYQLVRNKKLNLGTRSSSCKLPDELRGRKLIDLGVEFNYTYSACLSQQIGDHIANACNCVSAHHLVRQAPSRSQPFCEFQDEANLKANHSISISSTSSNDLKKRLSCVRDVDVPLLVQQQDQCPARCEYNKYKVSVSSATWEPSDWQMHFVLEIGNELELVNCTTGSGNCSIESDRLKRFLHHTDLHKAAGNTGNSSGVTSMEEEDLRLEHLALATVSRLTYNTIRKVETQQVTLSALLSRIGGIGSLTIGCTLALFFELLEFSSLYFFKVREARREARKKACEVGDESNNNHESVPLSTELSSRS